MAHAETAPGYPLQVLATNPFIIRTLRAFRYYPLREYLAILASLFLSNNDAVMNKLLLPILFSFWFFLSHCNLVLAGDSITWSDTTKSKCNCKKSVKYFSYIERTYQIRNFGPRTVIHKAKANTDIVKYRGINSNQGKKFSYLNKCLGYDFKYDPTQYTYFITKSDVDEVRELISNGGCSSEYTKIQNKLKKKRSL